MCTINALGGIKCLEKYYRGVPLLCLALQSTGHTAGTVVREVFEFGAPAARRVLSTVRPLASLFTFQPPVPMAKHYFSTAPSDVFGQRHFSTKVKVTAFREVPSRLNVDDPWDKIDEVTRSYAPTVGTIDESFKNPARWMQELADTFSVIRSTEIHSMRFREDVVDTIYLWDQALKNLSKYKLDEAQQVAIDNINVIREKVIKEMNR